MNFQERYENWLKGSEEERKQGANELILSLANDLRNIAAPFGSMHPLWDGIVDMEEFANGRPTVVKMAAEEWIQYAASRLKHLTPSCLTLS